MQNPEQIKQNKLFAAELELQDKYIIPFHRAMGKLNGYPDCCVEQFCAEQKVNIPSSIYRMSVHKKVFNLGYVPCDKCAVKL